MKKIVLPLVVLLLTTIMYSQKTYFIEIDDSASLSAKKNEGIALHKNSNYKNDASAEGTVKKLEEAFLHFNSNITYTEGEAVVVKIYCAKGELNAYYDANLVLQRVEETYKAIQIPSKVRASVSRNYPGWSIVNSKYFYNQEQETVEKQEYWVKIQKDGLKQKVRMNPEGAILKE
ncbi:hypothetical protein ACSVH5_11825 [Flavobacterium sp. RSSA_27]|uniref:hypothetical protein n=1 Tax=Flavobacterium sp. RSSA_27 TaxID=3447667 RepID=UPI003F2AE434